MRNPRAETALLNLRFQVGHLLFPIIICRRPAVALNFIAFAIKETAAN